jgi:hypothetical protein
MIKRTMKLKSNASRPSLPKAASFEAEPSNVQLTKSAVATSQARRIQTPKSQSVLSRSANPGPVKADLPKAHLELVKPEAKSVFVAGSFNEWNPARTPLTRKSDGKWVGDLSGITGRHEYLFVVDGQWLPDPNAEERVQNPFGGWNSVLVVAG